MTNSLVKATLKDTLKKKSPAAPKGPRQNETMGASRSMDPGPSEMEMRAREDARTLHEAHKIRNDKSRLSAVKDHVASMSEALSGPVTVAGKRK